MRKPWIGTIHGLRCSKYGSLLCAGNPWIAQHLRDPWIAQPHMCQAFVQKKKGDQSRERKGYRRLLIFRLANGETEESNFWLKSRGFRLLDYPCAALGLRNSSYCVYQPRKQHGAGRVRQSSTEWYAGVWHTMFSSEKYYLQ